mgnify:CR=1 FL=1
MLQQNSNSSRQKYIDALEYEQVSDETWLIKLDPSANWIEDGKKQGVFRADVGTGILKNLLFGALDHATMLWVNNPHRQRADLEVVGDHLIALIDRAVIVQS